MRTLLTAALLLTGVSMLTPAAAQEKPWCALYSLPGGAKNCGFSTFAQCQAAVSGAGGTCSQNPFYVGNSEATTTKTKKRKRSE
jgi:hypothetical protein